MKFAVFGATGGLGREVVRAAHGAGHGVRAMVRDPAKLEATGIEAEVGDLSDTTAIGNTIRGTEAVLSCVGVVKGGDPAVFGTGLRAIVDAMSAHSVHRLVAISGAGLELDGDVTGLGRRMIITALELFARDVLRGKELEWEAICDRDVDWTDPCAGGAHGRPARRRQGRRGRAPGARVAAGGVRGRGAVDGRRGPSEGVRGPGTVRERRLTCASTRNPRTTRP